MKQKQRKIEDSFLMVQPLADSAVERSRGGEDNSVLKLQLDMATNSINHEYARIEFEDTFDAERKEELLDFMHDCREKYFEARDSLVTLDPQAVQDFEVDLMQQKLQTMNRFQA